MIYVFNRDLSERWMLLKVESLVWTEKYCGIGTFSLVTGDTAENAKMLRKGNLLHFGVYDGVIVSVSVSGGKVVVNGYSLAYLLNQRTPMNDAAVVDVESDLYSLYTQNRRGLDVDVSEPKDLPGVADIAVSGGKIGEWVEEACKQAGLGFRVTLDVRTKRKLFEIYKGEDLTSVNNPKAVHFSTATNTLTALSMQDDAAEFANVAVVRGKDLQERYVVQIVGNATGADRHEIFVDATNDPQKDEQKEYDDEGNETNVIPAETMEEYKARLRALGTEELQNHLGRLNFEVTISPEDYGVRYKLGDVVLCNSPKHGLKLSAVVSEVKHTIDRQKETIQVVLGEPKLRLKELVSLWRR